MCRSIKTLRPPYAEQVTDEDIRAAALQYVRKISGADVLVGHLFGVRRAEGLDASAHAFDRTWTWLPESEQALQAYGEAGREGADAAYGEQHPRHERGPVQRVVPDRQRLAGPAEQHLLVRHQARHPHRVH